MNQRQPIQKIYQNKKNRQKSLDEFRRKLIVQMYRSLTDRESYIKRVKKLVQIQTNKNEPVDKVAVKMAISSYNKIKDRKEASVPAYGMVGGSIMFAFLIDNKKINDAIRSVIYKNEISRVSEEKEAFIMSDINKNRIMHKMFYLCSKHDDCAKDHKAYQGKIYIDEKWKDYADDAKAVESYIHKHNIHEYQWVMGEPVYLLTRPNCRHYMMPLSEDEVLQNSKSSLIDKYNMHRKIGDRADMQTLSSRGREIETIINAYKDRLKLHQDMYKVQPNDFLKAAINKDTILLRKWILKK